MRFNTSLLARAATVLAVTLAVSTISAFQETAAVYQGEAAEQFLRKARIVTVRDLGTGIALPKKVTLTQDGITRFAVFKSINESKAGTMTVLANGRAETDFQDSWQTEVAAYIVDKIIGLGLVPATVERLVNREAGSLQWFVESAMTEKQRVTDKISPPDVEAWQRLTFKMRLFDQLIANVDRHANNLLVTKEFELRLIDHSRSFRTNSTLGKPDELIRFSQSLLDGIQRLEKKDLRAKVGRYLTPGQIDRMLQRRDAILALVKVRVAEKGEAAVIYP